MVRIAIQRISAKRRLIVAALALVVMYLVVSTNILSFSAIGETQTGAAMYIHADAPITVKAGEKFTVEVALFDQAGERITGRKYANDFGGIQIGAAGIKSSDGYVPQFQVDTANFIELKDTQGNGIGVYRIPVTVEAWPVAAQTDLYGLKVTYIGEGTGSVDGAASTAYRINDVVTFNRDNAAVPGRVRYAVAEPDKVTLTTPKPKPNNEPTPPLVNTVRYRVKLVGQTPIDQIIGRTITERAQEIYRQNWMVPTVIDNTGAAMKAALGAITEETVTVHGQPRKTGIYNVEIQIETDVQAAGRKAVVSFGYVESGIEMPLESTINFTNLDSIEEAVPNMCFANPYIISPPHTPVTSELDLAGLENDMDNITHWTNGTAIVRLNAFVDNSVADINVDAAEFFIDTVGAEGTGTQMLPDGGVWDSPSKWVYFDIPVLTLQGLSEGSHNIYVRGRETASVHGGAFWGPTSAEQLKLFIDRTPPSVTVGKPDPYEFVNGPNYPVIGNTTNTPGGSGIAPIAAVQVYEEGQLMWMDAKNDASRGGTNFSTWIYQSANQWNTTAISDGFYKLRTRVTDVAGNTSIGSTFKSGTILKAGTTTTSAADKTNFGGTWSGTGPYTLTTASQTLSGDVVLAGTVNVAAASTLKLGTILVPGTTATSSTDKNNIGGTAWLGAGPYALVDYRTLTADVVLAGTVNAGAEVTIPVNVDNTAPSIYFISPTNNQGFTAESIPITATVTGVGTYTVEWGEGVAPTAWTTINTGASPLISGLAGTWNVSALPDGAYTIRLRGVDEYGNSGWNSIKIYLDHVAPSSAFTAPPDGSYGRSSVTFTGTADDAVSGVSEVKLRLKRSSDGYCWNGSSWLNNDNTWVAATITSGQGAPAASWQYAWTISQIGQGDTVTAISRAKDVAGHEETPATGRTVTVDTTAPTINWAGPTPDQWYTSAQTISVNVTDAYSGPAGFRWNWNADSGDLLSVNVGDWRVNEGSGNIANDVSTYANRGTIYGANYWTNSGKYGHAFSGSGDDYIRVANSASLNSASFSVEMWVYATSRRMQGLASKWSGTHGWRLFMANTSGNIEFDAYGEVANIQTPALNANTWYHVVATYDAPSQTAKIYLDGAYKQQATSVDMQNTYAYNLDFSPSVTNRLAGRLDDIKFYNRALTADEVAKRATEGSSLLNVTGGGTGTTPFLSEGKNALYVWAYNNAGNSASGDNEYWYDPTTPGGWDNFTRTYNTQTPNANIGVSDATSGLSVNTGSAQYSYSTNGGSTWSAWANASVTGTNGTKTVQTITATAIPFPGQSTTLNYVRFRISDVAGNGHNTGQQSPAYLIDNSVPSVTSIYPSAGATNVEVGTIVKANFSEQLLSSSLNTTTFKLYNTTDDPGLTLPLPGSVTYFEKTGGSVLGFFTPSTVLDFTHTYRAVITTGVRDVTGNYMIAEYNSSFTTAAIQAALVSPSIGQSVTGTAVDVRGTARGNANFSQYTLWYGAGASPGSWTAIGTNPRTGQVNNATLGTWNVSALADGVYTIRLLVYDTGTTVLERRETVRVDNTGPTAAVTLPAEGATIYGTYNATGTGADTPSGVSKVEVQLDSAGSWFQATGSNRTEENAVIYLAAGAGGPYTLTADRTIPGTSYVTLLNPDMTTMIPANSTLAHNTILRTGTIVNALADTTAIGGTWTGTGPYTLTASRTLAADRILADIVYPFYNSQLHHGTILKAGTVTTSTSDKTNIGGTWTGGEIIVPWIPSNDAGASGGYQNKNSAATATATYNFTGTAVTFISTRGPDRGYAQIYVDGTRITDGTIALPGDSGGNKSGLDLFSADTRYQERVYTKAGLTSGAHTIKVVVVGDMNALSQGTRVDIDAFDVGGSVNWTYALNTSSLSLGSHTIRARATDRSSGLVGAITAVRTFIVSAIPTALITSPAANDLAGDFVEISGIAVGAPNFLKYDLQYGAGASPASWYNINTLKAADGSVLKTGSILKTGTIATDEADKSSMGGTWIGGAASGFGPYVLITSRQTTVANRVIDNPDLTIFTIPSRFASGTIFQPGTTAELEQDKISIGGTAWSGGMYTLNRTRVLTANVTLANPELTNLVARTMVATGSLLKAGTIANSLADKNALGGTWTGTGPYALAVDLTTTANRTLLGNLYAATGTRLQINTSLRAGVTSAWADDKTALGGTWWAVGPFTLTAARTTTSTVELNGTLYVTTGSTIRSGSRLCAGTTTNSAADKTAYGGTWSDAWTGTGPFTLTADRTLGSTITLTMPGGTHLLAGSLIKSSSRLTAGTIAYSATDKTNLGGTWTGTGPYVLRTGRLTISGDKTLVGELIVDVSSRLYTGSILKAGTHTYSDRDRVNLGGTWVRTPFTLTTADRTLAADRTLIGDVDVPYASTLKAGTTLAYGSISTSLTDALNIGGTWTGGSYTLSANRTIAADRILTNADPTPVAAGSILKSGTTLGAGTTADSLVDTGALGGVWTGSGPYTLSAYDQTLSADRTLVGAVNVIVGSTLKSGTTLGAGTVTASWDDMAALGGTWAGSGPYTLVEEEGRMLTSDIILTSPGLAPVTSGKLGTWVASDLLEQGYSLKLTVTDTNLTTKTSTVYPLVIDHTSPYAEITSPVNMDYVDSNFTLSGIALDYTSAGVKSDISVPAAPDPNQIDVVLIKGLDSFVPETVDLGAVDTLAYNATTKQWEWTKSISKPPEEEWGWFSLQVSAKDRALNMRDSNITYNCIDVSGPPAPVLRGQPDKDKGSISLFWTPVKDVGGGIDYYEVERDGVIVTSNLMYYDGIYINALDDVGRFYGSNALDTDITAGHTVSHTYRVRAVDYRQQPSVWSSPLVIKYDDEAPTAPTGLTASTAGSTNSLYLQWNSSNDDLGVTEYKIYRTESPTGEPSSNPNNFLANVSATATYAATTFFDDNLTPSTTYRYQAVAYDGQSNMSAGSNVASGTAGANPSYDSPHGAFATDTDTCVICHRTHTGRGTGLVREQTATEVCYSCHDGTASAYATKQKFDYAPAGGHRVKDDIWPNGALTCIDCHNPHGNPDHASFEDFENDLGVSPDGWTIKSGIWTGEGNTMATALGQTMSGAGQAYIVKDTGLDVNTKGGKYAVKVKLEEPTGHVFFTIGGDGEAARSGVTVDLNPQTQTMSLMNGDSVIRSEDAPGLNQTDYWYRIRIKIGANKDVAVSLYRFIDDSNETKLAGFTATVPTGTVKSPSTFIALGTQDTIAEFDNVKVNDVGMLMSRYRSYSTTLGGIWTGSDPGPYTLSIDRTLIKNITSTGGVNAVAGTALRSGTTLKATTTATSPTDRTNIGGVWVGDTLAADRTLTSNVTLTGSVNATAGSTFSVGTTLKAGTTATSSTDVGSHNKVTDDNLAGEEFCLACHGNATDSPGGSHRQYYTSVHNQLIGSTTTQPETLSPRWQTLRNEWKEIKQGPLASLLKGTNNGCLYCHGYHGSQFYSLRAGSEESLCFRCHGLDTNFSRTGANIYQQYQEPYKHGLAAAGATIRCTSCHGQRGISDRFSWEGFNTSMIADPANIKTSWATRRTGGASVDDFCNTCHQETNLPVETHTSTILVPYTIMYPPMYTTPSANGFIRTGYSAKDTNDNYIVGHKIWTATGNCAGGLNPDGTGCHSSLQERYPDIGDITQIPEFSKKIACTTCHDQHASEYPRMIRLPEDSKGDVLLVGTVNMADTSELKTGTIFAAGTTTSSEFNKNYIGGTAWTGSGLYTLTANRTLAAAVTLANTELTTVVAGSRIYSTTTAGSQTILKAGTMAASVTDTTNLGGTWTLSNGVYTLSADWTITTAGLKTLVGTLYVKAGSKLYTTGTVNNQTILNTGTVTSSLTDKNAFGGANWATGDGLYTLTVNRQITANVILAGTVNAAVGSTIRCGAATVGSLLKATTTATSSRDTTAIGGTWTGTGPYTLSADATPFLVINEGMCLHCHDGSITD